VIVYRLASASASPPNSVCRTHLHLAVREPAGPPVDPVGQLLRHVEGLVVACQLVLVDHPGQVLVDHVVRRPDRLPLLQDVEVPLGERGQVAGAETPAGVLRLEHGELADQVLAAALRVAVAGVGVGEREGGQQVAGHVAADLRIGLLPAAERHGGGGLAVVDAEGAEHPFGVQEQQVGGVPGLIQAERAVEQLDRIEGQGRGPARGAVGSVAAGFGGRGPGLHLRAGRRGDAVGDQGLFGDQGAGTEAEHGERPTPAQARAGLSRLCLFLGLRGLVAVPATVHLLQIRDPLPGQHSAEDRTSGYLSM